MSEHHLPAPKGESAVPGVTEPPWPALPESEAPLQASVVYRLREPHGDDLGLVTQLVLGARPVMLIHIRLGDEDELQFDVDATGPSDADELASTLELLVHVLRTGEAEPAPAAAEPEVSDG